MPAPNGKTAISPAIARYHDRTYIFWGTANAISYRWTSSEMNCPVPAKARCAAWDGLGTIPIPSARGLDVVRFGSGSGTRLIVVAINSEGQLVETRLAISGSSEMWTTPVAIDSSEVVSGEPSLAAMDDCDVTLAYKSEDGTIRTRRLNCDSSIWDAPTTVRDHPVLDLTLPAGASPSIARGYVPREGAAPQLLGAFLNASGKLRLYVRNEATGRWRQPSEQPSMSAQGTGRPAMAWVPSGGTEFPGRLYILYRQKDDGAFRWMWSYTKMTRDGDGNEVATEAIGLDSFFDNKWYVGTGHDFLNEHGVDTNLRAVIATNDTVALRPKSDGIQDFSYRNYDDWQVLRVGLCRQVVNPGGRVSDPIRCAERDW